MSNFFIIIVLSLLFTLIIVPIFEKIIKSFFKENFSIRRIYKWIIFVISMILLYSFDIDYKKTLTENLPLKLSFSKEEPKVNYSIKIRDVSKYSEGDTIEGVYWSEQYEKYEISITNESDYSLYDFKFIGDIPGYVIRKEIISSYTDNIQNINVKKYDYENEILEMSKDDKYIYLEGIVDNRIDFTLTEFEKNHKIGIWFIIKRIKINGKIIFSYYNDSEKEERFLSGKELIGKNLVKPLYLSDTSLNNFRARHLSGPLKKTRLNQNETSKSIYKPEY